ncbi:hypothetical protein LR48_Vigan04g020500 [Vigna angularis]|uniref:Uncharacterized protein n=1 Tax=Phaseolus angularis TaxID=3914 RepID=A0A0L9UBU6_PHAAN|nr:hypothetical protein LR48_Vigan04g020500 [Vigna angularis]
MKMVLIEVSIDEFRGMMHSTGRNERNQWFKRPKMEKTGEISPPLRSILMGSVVCCSRPPPSSSYEIFSPLRPRARVSKSSLRRPCLPAPSRAADVVASRFVVSCIVIAVVASHVVTFLLLTPPIPNFEHK